MKKTRERTEEVVDAITKAIFMDGAKLFPATREKVTKIIHQELQKAQEEVLLKVMQEIDDSKTEYNPVRHGIEPDDIFDRVRSCVSSVVLEYYGRYDALDRSELLNSVTKDWEKQAENAINGLVQDNNKKL